MIDPNQFLTGTGSPAAKFPVIGTTVVGTITTEPTVVQQTAFGTNEPLAWADGSPRLQMVVEVNTATGPQRFFIKSGLKNAVADAVRASGSTGLAVGGTLSVTYSGDAAPTRPGIAGAKVYTATYAPPAPVAVAVPAGPPIVPAPTVSVPTAPPVTAADALAALV
jgi:hypothetical protein